MSTFFQTPPRAARLVRRLALLSALVGGPAIADDTPAQARTLGINPASVYTYDYVGDTDYNDYYRFQVTTTKAVSVKLTGSPNDADLFLTGDNGVFFSSRQRGNGFGELIRANLAPGNYQIQVSRFLGNINYRLDLRTWTPTPATNGEKRNLSPLDGMNGVNTAVSASGTIQPTTGYIDYHFTLPGDRQIDIFGQGNVAAGVTPLNFTSWQILQNNRLSTTLGAGTHFLRVFRNPMQAESFSFTIMARPINTNDTAGYNTRTARNLGRIGNPPTKVEEYVGEHDFDDYYRVVVTPNSQLNVALAHGVGSEDANVRVIDTLGRQIAQSANLGGANENIRVNVLVGGVYYIHVGIADREGPVWQDARYTMNVGTVPMQVSLPGNPRPQPIPVPFSPSEPRNNDRRGADFFARGELSPTPFPQTGTVGPNDPSDWYEFRVPCIPDDPNQQAAPSATIPSFSLTPSPGVDVSLFQVKAGGQLAPLTFTPGDRIRPEFDSRRPTPNYKFVIQVTPSSSSSMTVPYTITGQTEGCFSP